MEIKWKDYEVENNILNFTIKNTEFNGIITKDKKRVMDILFLKNKYTGSIIIDEKEIDKKDINNYKKKIIMIKEFIPSFFQNKKIFEYMYYEIRRKNLKLKNPKKKMIDSLKIVGLEIDYLNRNIDTLSSSEKKLVQIGICLMCNPEVIIMEEPFKCFDMKATKKIVMLLQKIKDQYEKTFIIISNDTNMLYRYANHLIIYKNNKILVEGNSKEILERVDFLRKNRITIPEIVEFTYLAKKKKNVKIDYHKDVRDIIKDIYKHV